MVAVPGLAFAFSEAGPHMGSLLQAVWALMQLGQLLTGAIALGGVKPYVAQHLVCVFPSYPLLRSRTVL